MKLFALTGLVGLCLSWSLSLGLAPAHAADTEPTPPKATDPLGAARTHIAAKRWPAAIVELQKVNGTGSADWNNLMGYALRKQAAPDLDGAQRHYDAALRIDPRHRGALEYAGELALMKGNLPAAEEKLAALARICTTPCEELTDLKKMVERYKAGGHRYP